MKKRLFKIIIAGIMAVSLTACTSGSKEQAKGVNTASDKDLEEVTVVLDWYPNAVHGFIYTAIDKGYYEEEGLKVNIQFPSNTNDAISLTAAGKADLGMYYPQDIIIAKGNEGIPIKTVGTIVQEPLNVILSLKDKNILSPKDLVGKKIGYAGSHLAEELVATMLESIGKDGSSTEMIDVGFDLMSSMTTGNVDATIGCVINHEVPQIEEEGFQVNYFFPKDYGVPHSNEYSFVTGEGTLKKNPDKIKKFLRASKKGFEDMKKDPEESLKILLNNQNEENFPLNENVERKSFEYLIPVMESTTAEFLTQDLNTWQENIEWLYERGVLKNRFEANEIVEDMK